MGNSQHCAQQNRCRHGRPQSTIAIVLLPLDKVDGVQGSRQPPSLGVLANKTTELDQGPCTGTGTCTQIGPVGYGKDPFRHQRAVVVPSPRYGPGHGGGHRLKCHWPASRATKFLPLRFDIMTKL
jgi:hypothetical protein